MMNLGNTCFLNSVIQNLFALEPVRHYFLDLEVSPGPLTYSLKELALKICEESDSSAINPEALFLSVCSKAPQFRGNQPQDAQEFLRFLLDGLSMEELNARKEKTESAAQEDVKSEPTFVVDVFGGQLCSTVTCMDCGQSSEKQQLFLDLLLPLPTRKAQQVVAGTRDDAFEAIKSAESDEVDNSDGPISVKRCLSYFIESEQIKKKCENCTKSDMDLGGATLCEEPKGDLDATQGGGIYSLQALNQKELKSMRK